MKKYVMRLILVLALVLGLGLTTYADEVAELTLIRGTLVKVGKDTITVSNEKKQVIPVDEEAVIVDAMSLMGITLEELMLNQPIEVYVDEDGEAEVIVGNIPQDVMAPRLVEVEKIEKTGDYTGRVLVDNGGLWISIVEDTVVNRYIASGMMGIMSIPKLDEIKVGQELLITHGPVATSYPGQTTAEKVLILPLEELDKDDLNTTNKLLKQIVKVLVYHTDKTPEEILNRVR